MKEKADCVLILIWELESLSHDPTAVWGPVLIQVTAGWFSLFPVSGNIGSRQSCFPCSQLEVSEEFEGKGACLHLDSTLQV